MKALLIVAVSASTFVGHPVSGFDSAPGKSAQGAPELVVRMSRQGPLVSGQKGTYIFELTNNGKEAMAGPFVVTYALPTELSSVKPTWTTGPTYGPANWSCSARGQVVTCRDTEPLAPAQTSRLLMDVTVTGKAGATVKTCAKVKTAKPKGAEPEGCDAGAIARS